MSDRFFVDTNIFIYSFENSSKGHKARAFLNELLTTDKGTISYQVIQEFLNAISKKIIGPINENDWKLYLEDILYPLCTVFPSKSLFLSGMELKNKYKIGFYDSLIVAAALQGNCTILASEDLNHTQKYGQLTVLNPFK